MFTKPGCFIIPILFINLEVNPASVQVSGFLCMDNWIRKNILLLIFSILLPASGLFAQVNQQKLPEKTRILFLLDASGSMLAKWENTYRIVVAKTLLSEMVDSLRNVPNVELALRVYGHQFHRKFQNCEDTRLETPFGPANHDAIKKRLASITPQGNTPIAYSIEKAADDFPNDGTARNIIIVITDGLESCDGDPCAVSISLQRKGIFLKPFIVGIGMDKKFEEQFKCVGDFFDASDISAFRTALRGIVNKSLQRATVSVELLDSNDQPTETDINVTFLNNFTGQATYEFVHYLDRQGRPDSVEVDPVLTYDVVVNTIPPAVRRNVEIEGGRHNLIRIKAPQGSLKVSQAGHTEYRQGVGILVRQAGENGILYTMQPQQSVRLLLGKYDIEALTLPRTVFRNVEVRQSRTTELEIAAPGVVNISSTYSGFGSIYKLKDDGTQEWIHNLDPAVMKTTLAMQPGKYKVVFRSKNSMGSKFTQIKEFSVRSGGTIDIRFAF